MKEWPAVASVVQATREHKECFWGHEAATFQTQMLRWEHSFRTLRHAIIHCFPCVTYLQSLKHKVPETRELIKAAGVCSWLAEDISMPSLCSLQGVIYR